MRRVGGNGEYGIANAIRRAYGGTTFFSEVGNVRLHAQISLKRRHKFSFMFF